MGFDLSIQPIKNAVDVTPSNTVNLTRPARGLYVGVTGNVVVINLLGNIDTYTNLAAGIWHPIAFTRVNATGTTATNILAGY
jgi:hypothetical protein